VVAEKEQAGNAKRAEQEQGNEEKGISEAWRVYSGPLALVWSARCGVREEIGQTDKQEDDELGRRFQNSREGRFPDSKGLQ
jgi:hypothetical protein